ncbi:GntR family transcriptional regulator [Caryophanon tenue]|uniref:GntR family transcriptional regulator n=1 Tax=Caryophanon tenue TaxID=33978 RepID=A0A1C0YCH1_9BACL|nr:GntR family transcriptional regulator [Caryophanon tenue]
MLDLLLFQLDKTAATPLYEQLYEAIKHAIIEQKIPLGSKLPSKRKLADFLAISQTTIELAYGQLLAEGYISTKPRVGFFVEDLESLPIITKLVPQPVTAPPQQQTWRYSFHPGKIDSNHFPFTAWRKYAKDIFDESSKELLSLGDPQGEYALRVEIAQYLYQSRGIHCDPAQIVIGSGTEQLLPIIMRLLGDDAQFAIENPGYSAIPRIHLEHIIPIHVDEEGLRVDELTNSDANVVYVTPSHQFPTGAVLSVNRRTKLLKWANEKQYRYIIEDDYDSEFRYIGKPIPALYGLDQNNKVIYLSTFTKSLMPSLRVAYVVLPPSLLQTYRQLFNYYSCTVPRFDQHILARFMQHGHFARHLNRMRKLYRKKHDRLIHALQPYGHAVTVFGDQAGMHILICLRSRYTEQQLKQFADDAQIQVFARSDYFVSPIPYSSPALLLGFGDLEENKIEEAVDALMHSLHIQKE